MTCVKTEPLITEELAEFLQSGVSIAIATRNGDLDPNGTRAWAATVDDDRVHVTVYLYTETAEPILRDLGGFHQAAVVFDRPSDSRACQLKGTFVGSRPCAAEERVEVERQVSGFFADLETIGVSRALMAGWKFWPSVAVRMRVAELFHQTPGPGAGEPMR
jgi:hypothetical protein